MEVNVAAPEAFLDLDGVCGLVEQVFSGLQRTAMADVAPKDECMLAANHARRLEFGSDAARGIAGTQHHKDLPGGSNRSQKKPSEPARGGTYGDKEKPEDFTHDGDSLDDHGRCA